MGKTLDKAKVSTVAELLRRIDGSDDLRLLATDVSRMTEHLRPAELAAAGRRLLEEGYAPTLVMHLSAALVLMQRYEQQRSDPGDESMDGHILQRVAAEHAVFRCLAAELREAAADLGAVEGVSDTTAEYRRLAHVVAHLRAMKEHFEREDDVILPYLRRCDWTSLCTVAGNDHAQLRALIDCLTSLVTESHSLRPEDFRSTLFDCIGRFGACLTEHLSFEDGLLWPIALVVIDDPAVWATMKVVCEEIGYCGIHVT